MKRFLTAFLTLLLLVCLAATVFATTDEAAQAAESERLYVIDHAELLTDVEEEALARTAREISQRQQCDVVILTEFSTGSKSLRAYADDYFDFNGYGYGQARSGVLFLLSIQNRDWYMSARGEGSKIFTDDKMDKIWEQCASEISSDNYANGFRIFLQASDAAINDYQKASRIRLVKVTLFSVVIGFLAAFIFSGSLRAQLKTVHMKYSATNYRRPDSMHLERNRDIYLYANTSSRVIETNRSSGGGSSHISSSGATHTGHGGKF